MYISTRRPAAYAAIALALCLLAEFPSSVSAQVPIAQPLVQPSDMQYLGWFAVPTSDGSGAAEGLLTYGGTALSVNPATQTLLIGGHDWYQRLCEVGIPAVSGATAPIVQRCADVTEGRKAQIDTDSVNLGGTLVWNGRLIVSAYSYYDADGSARFSHFASGLNLAQQGDVQGPYQVGTAGAGYVAGYMAVVPPEWRALLGGPALTGQCCLSIISRTSSGPSISVFDPDNVGRVSPVPSTVLLGYPLSNPLAANSAQNTLFNNATEIGGVAFPPGTRSVLFIGKQGVGPYCYGTGDECQDPVQSYKGTHAYPYVLQVWAYDANDLLAVKLGLRTPWSVRPYATWQLADVASAGNASIAGAAYDHTTGRLYITEDYGEHPRVHVYQVGHGSGQALAIPGAPQGLTGRVDGSLATLSWSPPAGAAWAGYLLQAGTSPGASNIVQVPLGAATTTVSAPVPPGQYYARVLAFNAQSVPGPASNEIVLTVGARVAVADRPQNFRVSVAGNSVTLAWNPPATGGVTDYVLDAGTAPGASNLLNGLPIGGGFTIAIPGVPPGAYYVRIRARNAGGVSAPSNEASFTVAPVALPGAPTDLRAVTGPNRTVTLSWGAPTSGGAATGYILEVGLARGVAQLARDVGTLTAVAVPGTPPGVYYVRVRARNAAGAGPPSGDVRIVVR